MLTGSLGLLPSASLGEKDKNGKTRSMYEPVHGSAPDIAGKNIANPIATVLSFSMALRFSLDLDKEANLLDAAVQKVLDEADPRTPVNNRAEELIGRIEFAQLNGY